MLLIPLCAVSGVFVCLFLRRKHKPKVNSGIIAESVKPPIAEIIGRLCAAAKYIMGAVKKKTKNASRNSFCSRIKTHCAFVQLIYYDMCVGWAIKSRLGLLFEGIGNTAATSRFTHQHYSAGASFSSALSSAETVLGVTVTKAVSTR